MARGGFRPGAGRKKLVHTKRTRDNMALVDQLRSEGLTPLDAMVKAMRIYAQRGDIKEMLLAAEKAAPYLHPRLTSIRHSGNVGTYDLTKASDEQLGELEKLLTPIAIAGGDTGGEAQTQH